MDQEFSEFPVDVRKILAMQESIASLAKSVGN